MKLLIPMVLACALVPLSCSRQENAQANASPSPQLAAAATKLKIDACTLLTARELESVQGEALQTTQGSGQVIERLSTEQCYFALPTQSNSVVLTVTQPADASGVAELKSTWQEMFHKPKAVEQEGGKKKEPPLKVEGIGDEAFWAGNDQIGALYVLTGESYIRISVGGGGRAGEKLDKSKTLAGFVLGHL